MKHAVVLSLLFVAVYAVDKKHTTAHTEAPTDSTSIPNTTGIDTTVVTTIASTSESVTTARPTSYSTSESVTTAGPTSYSTTSEHVTSTAAPSPNFYAVKSDKTDTYCIVFKANISINVAYNNSKNQILTNVVYVPKPADTKVMGECGNGSQLMHIQFKNWILSLTFEGNANQYNMSSVSLSYDLSTADLPDHPNGTGNVSGTPQQFQTSKVGYFCQARKTLFKGDATITGIYTEQLHFEAFQNQTTPTLSDKYEKCSEDNISNLVPIIVGACLGGLIIVVLIAYLIGRKRSRRGYESV